MADKNAERADIVMDVPIDEVEEESPTREDLVDYFPRYTLKRSGLVAPDERPPGLQSLVLGLQHVLAMFGSTVLAPLLMGFDTN
ncbi:hypothetical protein BC936DRAFT_147476, partial [Jimgerdemannia flammicorona]